MAKRKKNRRIKKPKYLSLRLQFPGEKVLVVDNSKSIDPHIVNPVPTSTSTVDHHHHHQVEDDDDMEYLLSTSDGGATSTLTGLLLDSSDAFPAPVPVCSSDVDRAAADQLSPSASVSYVSDLVRTALRSRERESSNIEERYVRYSEVVNDDLRRRDHEEVTSDYYCNIMKNDYNQYYNQTSADYNQYHNQTSAAATTRLKRLSLKLDYDEIINAWSDKGGFYVQHSDLPQTVPDINHHIFSPPISNVGGGLWSVPELNGWWGEPMLKIEEEEVVVGVPQDEDHHHRPVAGEEWKWKAAAGQHREASVLRYKEKKRNRLFSKTIRYQVRKENAQKRPRVKGRFVKRS